jgi:hypothetical protein
LFHLSFLGWRIIKSPTAMRRQNQWSKRRRDYFPFHFRSTIMRFPSKAVLWALGCMLLLTIGCVEQRMPLMGSSLATWCIALCARIWLVMCCANTFLCVDCRCFEMEFGPGRFFFFSFFYFSWHLSFPLYTHEYSWKGLEDNGFYDSVEETWNIGRYLSGKHSRCAL